MESQIDVVLRFSDDRTVWICPECDMENDMTSASCDVCGCVRQPNAEIVSLYVAPTPVAPVGINDATATPYTGTLKDRAPSGGASRSTPSHGGGAPHGGGTPRYTPPEEKQSSNGWVWVAVVLFIIFAVIMANSGEF